MVDWSASELGSCMLFWQPQWHIHSASFCPHASVCMNISCKITDRCGVPRPHQEYLFRKSSNSTTPSASLKESLSSFTQVAGHLTLFHFVTIIQCQEGQVTRENNNNAFTCYNTSPIITPIGAHKSTVFPHTPIDCILILQHCFY